MGVAVLVGRGGARVALFPHRRGGARVALFPHRRDGAGVVIQKAGSRPRRAPQMVCTTTSCCFARTT